jgi:hypothetical protein
MKHSNDTSGFSSDSSLVDGHLPSIVEFSIFRPPFSGAAVLPFPGD